jgi:hypothetical protein
MSFEEGGIKYGYKEHRDVILCLIAQCEEELNKIINKKLYLKEELMRIDKEQYNKFGEGLK